MVTTTELASVEIEYLSFLAPKVTQSGRHNDLLTILFQKEFVWVVPNDDNRVEDGLDLRREFLINHHFFGSGRSRFLEVLNSRPCSVLEVLIGLSRRLSFMAGGPPEVWAWKLVENLEMHKAFDPLLPRKRDQINDRLDSLIFRTYNENGQGGFFPLAYPQDNQTEVELWYQMSAYIEENQLP